jgi:hypothetical protein
MIDNYQKYPDGITYILQSEQNSSGETTGGRKTDAQNKVTRKTHSQQISNPKFLTNILGRSQTRQVPHIFTTPDAKSSVKP